MNWPGWRLVPPVVVAEAGYGQNADFRDGLEHRSIDYVVAIRSDVTVHPRCGTHHPRLAGQRPQAATPLPRQMVGGGRAGGRPRSAGGHRGDLAGRLPWADALTLPSESAAAPALDPTWMGSRAAAGSARLPSGSRDAMA
jgi:hypothetical protein